MAGIWTFVKRNFLLLLILVLVSISYLNSCNSNKLITNAINKLKNADSLLDSAKGILASAAIQIDSARFYVKKTSEILEKASVSLDELKGINDNSLKTIHISLDNVNNIDKTKKTNDEAFRKQIKILESKIIELQNKIKDAQTKK
jgi:hypothetical protein